MATYTQARYTPRPLANPDDIRVLELFPAKEHSQVINCELHHRCLNSVTGTYIAISYAWGRRDVDDVVIDCNGCSARIPPTLNSALQRLRALSNESQLLWADALCINQEDTPEARDEKALHIPMMDRIFAGAQKVIVDLGEDNSYALNILRNLDHYQAIPDDLWSAVQENPSLSARLEILGGIDLPDGRTRFSQDFSSFICRPWFTRVWVIQEFVLARTVQFMVKQDFRGEELLEKGVLRAVRHLEWLWSYSRSGSSLVGPADDLEKALFNIRPPGAAVQHMVSLRNRCYNKGNTVTFCEQLGATIALFEATDKRDRAYALMGLASDSSLKRDLFVDYNEELPGLMVRVSEYLGSHGHGIWPLYHCRGVREDEVSWAVDLETKDRDELAHLIRPLGSARNHVFKACGSTTLSGNASKTRRSLILRGCIVDEIEGRMGTHFPSHATLSSQTTDPSSPDAHLTPPEKIRNMYDHFDSAFEWIIQVSGKQMLSEEAFVLQCWRTLIADLITGRGQEGLGDVRLRDWEKSAHCLDVWAQCHRATYLQKLGELSPSFKLPLPNEARGDLFLYGASVKYACGRRLALTKHRRVSCLIPRDAREGDQIAVIHGCPIPFILRRKVDDKGESFRIVGCAYVHGIMDGEAVTEGSDARDIEIC